MRKYQGLFFVSVNRLSRAVSFLLRVGLPCGDTWKAITARFYTEAPDARVSGAFLCLGESFERGRCQGGIEARPNSNNFTHRRGNPLWLPWFGMAVLVWACAVIRVPTRGPLRSDLCRSTLHLRHETVEAGFNLPKDDDTPPLFIVFKLAWNITYGVA